MLHLLDDIHARVDLAKDNVLPIQVRGKLSCYEELAAVRVWT